MAKAIKRLFFFTLQIYILLVAVLFVFQRSLLYIPSGTYHPPERYPNLPANTEEVQLTAADGNRTVAWLALQKDIQATKTMLFFHGNGGDLAMMRSIYTKIYDHGMGFMGLEYRGYPGAEGEPTEQGIYADARAAIDHLINQEKIPAENIILFGQSLGTGVAIQMATEYDVGGVVLTSPYTSMVDAASNRYPFVPVSLLLWDRYDSISKIADIDEPLYIFHGDQDRLIPIEQGRALYLSGKMKHKVFTAMGGHGHNDLDYDYILKEIIASPIWRPPSAP